MKEFVFESEQRLERPRDEVFPFFAKAENLDRITPPWLGFEIRTPLPIEMREGALIDYRIAMRGIPMRWRTRISAWEPPFRFVDEQLRGPYSRWIHEHRFEDLGSATLVRDLVRYAVPGGALIEWTFVRPEIERIFAFRQKKLAEIFPPLAAHDAA